MCMTYCAGTFTSSLLKFAVSIGPQLKESGFFQVVLMGVLLKVIGENKSKRKTHLNEKFTNNGEFNHGNGNGHGHGNGNGNGNGNVNARKP